MKKLYLSIFIANLLISGNVFADCSGYEQLFTLMAKRANSMQSVAANKYLVKPQANIYVAPQELKVLQNAQSQAVKLQLESSAFLQFTQIQMDLSKQIEAYWFDYWQNNPKSAPKAGQFPSLKTVREQIRTIDNQLYPQLATLIKNHPECSQKQLQSMFYQQFSSIQGVPLNPDFRTLMLNSLTSTVAVQK